jgi:hypothetical protein
VATKRHLKAKRAAKPFRTVLRGTVEHVCQCSSCPAKDLFQQVLQDIETKIDGELISRGCYDTSKGMPERRTYILNNLSAHLANLIIKMDKEGTAW